MFFYSGNFQSSLESTCIWPYRKMSLSAVVCSLISLWMIDSVREFISQFKCSQRGTKWLRGSYPMISWSISQKHQLLLSFSIVKGSTLLTCKCKILVIRLQGNSGFVATVVIMSLNIVQILFLNNQFSVRSMPRTNICSSSLYSMMTEADSGNLFITQFIKLNRQPTISI